MTLSVQSRMKPRIRANYDQADYRIDGVHGEITDTEARDILSSTKIFNPSDRDDVAYLIGELVNVMRMGSNTVHDPKRFATTYSVELVEFPIDVIFTACRNIRRSHEYFPSLAALITECEFVGQRRMVWKRAILDALSDAD